MTTYIRNRRTRVTKQDILKARESLLKQAEMPRSVAETTEAPRWARDGWHGLVYCDSYGWAWITDLSLETVCLGRIDEVIDVLKQRKVDTQDVAQVVQAVQEFQAEREIQSYHSAMENRAGGTDGHSAKSNRITFRDNPRFRAILEVLISEGYGVPTIQRELKHEGYEVPYATLGRWIRKRLVESSLSG